MSEDLIPLEEIAKHQGAPARGGHGPTDVIDPLTVASELLAVPHDDGKVECVACAHRCVIAEGRRGAFKVRYNDGGSLRVPWGYVGSLQVNPIEQAPFMHAHAGEEV